jgi:hypothetical protein
MLEYENTKTTEPIADLWVNPNSKTDSGRNFPQQTGFLYYNS